MLAGRVYQVKRTPCPLGLLALHKSGASRQLRDACTRLRKGAKTCPCVTATLQIEL